MANEKFTKTDMINWLASEYEFTKAEARKFAEDFTGLITGKLKKGVDVHLFDICILKKKKTKARTGRNPQTGEAIKIPAKSKVAATFKKAFKDSIVPPKKK